MDSIKRARWLARQTPNILCFLPPSNSGKMASRFASVTSEEIIQIIFCGVHYLTVLVYTKTTILGFHVTSEKKLKLEILPSSGKVIFCLQLGRPLCFENRTRCFHNAWHWYYFWETCYVHENIEFLRRAPTAWRLHTKYYYYTLYSLSAFWLTKSPLLILRIYVISWTSMIIV